MTTMGMKEAEARRSCESYRWCPQADGEELAQIETKVRDLAAVVPALSGRFLRPRVRF